MELSGVAAIVAFIFGGSGLVGGLIALLKYRGESTAVLVSASGEVVIMQKGMIASLREELSAAREEHAREVARCQARADHLERELESVRRDIQRSHSRHNHQDALIRELQSKHGGEHGYAGTLPGQEPENPPRPDYDEG